MKLPAALHRWDVSPKRAVALQRELAGRVLEIPLPGTPRYIAGADMAFTADGLRCVAGVVVWDRRQNEVLEQQTAIKPVKFPYIPGLLSFREAPAVLAACRKLKTEPEVFIFDGQGWAHPRRFGLACHAGLFLDKPSIGCAKSRLCGTHQTPRRQKGGRVFLYDEKEKLGVVLRTREGVKPVYVSVGHRITLETACRIVFNCCLRYRLPEPTRLADKLVSQFR